MGAATKIQWCAYTDARGVLVPGYTFNGWIGCEHAQLDGADDPACANCYAEAGTMARVQRHRGLPIWGRDAARHRTASDYWREPVKWDAEARAAGVRPRVFAFSLGDWAEDRRDLDPGRAELFSLVERCDALDWLLLTKRPDAVPRLVPPSWMRSWPRHAWIGASAGTQRALDMRAEQLHQISAAVRFLSLEPLIEAMDISRALGLCKCGHKTHRGTLGLCFTRGCTCIAGSRIDWVIVGGESGSAAREFNVAWARSIVRQCKAAGVAVFCKQLGAHVITRNDDGLSGCDEGDWQLADPDGQVEHDLDGTRDGYQGAPVRVHLRDKKGGDPSEWPADLRVREWPEVRGWRR